MPQLWLYYSYKAQRQPLTEKNTLCALGPAPPHTHNLQQPTSPQPSSPWPCAAANTPHAHPLEQTPSCWKGKLLPCSFYIRNRKQFLSSVINQELNTWYHKHSHNGESFAPSTYSMGMDSMNPFDSRYSWPSGRVGQGCVDQVYQRKDKIYCSLWKYKLDIVRLITHNCKW